MTPTSLVHAFLSALDPSVIESLVRPVANTLMVTVTPTLFVIALYIRLLEAQLSSLSGAGRYTAAFRDIALYGAALVLYVAIGGLVAHYLNAAYRALGAIGSLHEIGTQMTALIRVAAKRPQGVWADLLELNTLPLRIATVAIYYLTLVMTAVLEALLRIAQTVGYEFAFLYGLIALPLALSATLSLLRGWAKMMGFFLLWPVVQSLLLAVFSPIFTHALRTLETLVGPSDYMVVYAHMLFTVLNLILCAVFVAAPYITLALVDNAQGVQPFLVPYLSALTGSGQAIATHFESRVREKIRSWPEERAPVSFPPRPAGDLHVPADPDYHESLANFDVPRTNYLDPRFDAPPKDKE